MLLRVRMNVGMRGVWMMLRAVRKRAISEEEERYIGSAPSSTSVVGRFGQLQVEDVNVVCLLAV